MAAGCAGRSNVQNAPAEEQPKPISVSGSGDQVYPITISQSGIYLVSATAKATTPSGCAFMIYIKNTNGEMVQTSYGANLLIGETVPPTYDGTKTQTLNKGKYLLEVSGNGCTHSVNLQKV